ncbi:anthranilate phosphoribosyltransferase [Rubrobacter aplysinae]|uniref:anthranilate phosphoribosyltransferase n=1 Tax=Rubrobacter aplysinae TaxID=909625 RepID=UPI00064C389B
MLRAALSKAASGKHLSLEEAERALAEIMAGNASPSVTAALLTALRVRGESVSEIAGFARSMRRFAEKVEPPAEQLGTLVDTCGTGGDAKGTLNVSTAAAFVARGAGAPVAKHGNRSATSSSGSADVLEALGAGIELGPEAVSRSLEESGVGFMFARTHHPAMRHVAPVRAELPFRTVFNLLGPLTNPAGARHQLVGVFSEGYVRPMAEALLELGAERAMVVHGADGMDEITVTDRTHVAEVSDTGITEYELTPEGMGLSRHDPTGLLGGDASENARLLRGVLRGEPGAARDVTLANAGAAIYVSGLASSVAEGVALAAESVDSGAARESLEAFIRTTRRLSGLGPLSGSVL